MEVSNQEKQLYISNLELISPERAAVLGIDSNSPEFVSHAVNILFKERVCGLHEGDLSSFRFQLGKPMSSKEWHLGREVLDEWRIRHISLLINNEDYGKWIAILEDNGEAQVVKAQELRAYCWNMRWHEENHVKRLDSGYLLYDQKRGEMGYRYQAGSYYPVCDLGKHHIEYGVYPIYEFSISEEGSVNFKVVK